MTDPAEIRVLSGSPTDEETAAIAAVVTQLLLEQAASLEAEPSGPAGSAWDATRRDLRGPLRGPWR